MKTELNIPRELMTHVDVMNTLNGGTSDPSVVLKRFSSYREITFRIPGVQHDHVKMEINNNKLMVYFFTVIRSNEHDFSVPKILYDKAIPYFVDISKITSREDAGALIVKLPYNELANGYKRDISVND